MGKTEDNCSAQHQKMILQEENSSQDNLFCTELVKLLENNLEIRQLICTIVATDNADRASKNTRSDQETPMLSDAFVASPPLQIEQYCPPTDLLRQELSAELALLQLVQQDQELAAAWLNEASETEGRQLVRLIAIAAQWDQILQLWDRLADRCKEEQRPASKNELEILESCLEVHNFIWRETQARRHSLSEEYGLDFDYRQHERGTPKGDKITAEWLPGLFNAAGQLKKKTLVQT